MKGLSSMPTRRKVDIATKLIGQWVLAATLGSSVRAKGFFLKRVLACHWRSGKMLDIEPGGVALRIPEGFDGDYRTASAIVSSTLEGIEELPVIPREVEDILTISSTERHRWLKDGRLKSAGTRTVKLRGRARKITFHVFDPRHRGRSHCDLATVWREEDAATACGK